MPNHTRHKIKCFKGKMRFTGKYCKAASAINPSKADIV
jgi:hypothetical protein